MPVDVQARLAMRQLEHGYSLSQRIYTDITKVIPAVDVAFGEWFMVHDYGMY